MRGVSLVEIMLTIAIVGILLGLALPNFLGSLNSLKARSVTEKVLGGIQRARAEAVKRNAQVDFVITNVQGAAWTVQLADGTVIESYAGNEGSSTGVLLTATPAIATVSFDNLGQRIAPVAALGILTLAVTYPGAGDCQPSGPVRCLNVTVSIGGSARMCDPAATLADPTNPQAC